MLVLGIIQLGPVWNSARTDKFGNSKNLQGDRLGYPVALQNRRWNSETVGDCVAVSNFKTSTSLNWDMEQRMISHRCYGGVTVLLFDFSPVSPYILRSNRQGFDSLGGHESPCDRRYQNVPKAEVVQRGPRGCAQMCFFGHLTTLQHFNLFSVFVGMYAVLYVCGSWPTF